MIPAPFGMTGARLGPGTVPGCWVVCLECAVRYANVYLTAVRSKIRRRDGAEGTVTATAACERVNGCHGHTRARHPGRRSLRGRLDPVGGSYGHRVLLSFEGERACRWNSVVQSFKEVYVHSILYTPILHSKSRVRKLCDDVSSVITMITPLVFCIKTHAANSTLATRELFSVFLQDASLIVESEYGVA